MPDSILSQLSKLVGKRVVGVYAQSAWKSGDTERLIVNFDDGSSMTVSSTTDYDEVNNRYDGSHIEIAVKGGG